MQIEIKKPSCCIIPGATYVDWAGDDLTGVTCNTVMSEDGTIFHVWERGDCENCDGFPKISIHQFSQSPHAIPNKEKTFKIKAMDIRTGYVISSNEGPLLVKLVEFDPSTDIVSLEVTQLGKLDFQEKLAKSSKELEAFMVKIPKYPTGIPKRFNDYEAIEYDFTNPEHFALCDVDGVMTWLPVDFYGE